MEYLFECFLLVHLLVGQNVLDAPLEVGCRERFGDVAMHPLAEALFLIFHRGTGREDDNGQVGDVFVLLNVMHHREAVHHGHGDIGEDEVGHLPNSHFESFLSVLGHDDIVVTAQNAVKERAQVAVVLHHEDGHLLVGIVFGPAAKVEALFDVFCRIGIVDAFGYSRGRGSFTDGEVAVVVA